MSIFLKKKFFFYFIFFPGYLFTSPFLIDSAVCGFALTLPASPRSLPSHSGHHKHGPQAVLSRPYSCSAFRFYKHYQLGICFALTSSPSLWRQLQGKCWPHVADLGVRAGSSGHCCGYWVMRLRPGVTCRTLCLHLHRVRAKQRPTQRNWSGEQRSGWPGRPGQPWGVWGQPHSDFPPVTVTRVASV